MEGTTGSAKTISKHVLVSLGDHQAVAALGDAGEQPSALVALVAALISSGQVKAGSPGIAKGEPVEAKIVKSLQNDG